MKSITFTTTGEVRPPKMGEWYLHEGAVFYGKMLGDHPNGEAHKIFTMTESDAQTEGNDCSSETPLKTKNALGK